MGLGIANTLSPYTLVRRPVGSELLCRVASTTRLSMPIAANVDYAGEMHPEGALGSLEGTLRLTCLSW